MNDLTVAQQAAANEQALQDAFTNALTRILDFIPFQPEWLIGVTDLSRIVYFDLPAGEVRKTQAEDGRRIIIVGTPIGCVAMHERNVLGHGPFVLDVEAREAVEFMIGANLTTGINMETFVRILDPGTRNNIGTHMAKLGRVTAVHERVKARAMEKAEEAELFHHAYRDISVSHRW